MQRPIALRKPKARKLVQQDQVDVILGGIYSSTRQAIKGLAVVEGRKLYIYPEQYEGEECHPLLFCTGPVPAQQVESMIPWLMQKTGAKKFYCPSADYIWPRTMNRKLREVAAAHDGSIVGEEYFSLEHTDYKATVDKIMSSRAEVVFNTTVPPGVGPFSEQLHNSGFAKRGGHLVCTYFEENFLNFFPAAQVEELYKLPRLLPERQRSVQQGPARSVRQALSGRCQVHGGQCGYRHVPRFEALGGRSERGRLAEARRCYQGTGPCKDRAWARRAG